jgi:hypothetical protein
MDMLLEDPVSLFGDRMFGKRVVLHASEWLPQAGLVSVSHRTKAPKLFPSCEEQPSQSHSPALGPYIVASKERATLSWNLSHSIRVFRLLWNQESDSIFKVKPDATTVDEILSVRTELRTASVPLDSSQWQVYLVVNL